VNVHLFKQRSVAVLFATVLALSGCRKKVASIAPPPPAPPPAPTVSIHASLSAVQQGQASTLSWTSTNATQVTISGLGTVAANGSSGVTPDRSTDYTIIATAAGGASVQASTRVTVTAAPVAAAVPPSMTEEELFAQNVHDAYFDYDYYELRAADESTAQQDASFLKSHPGMKVLIEGHCDDRGSAEYNVALGQNRAETLRKVLVGDGVDSSRVRVISDGSEKPFCSDQTEACWQENRRDHLKLDR
jgi:peptidoglycan-associated lipoprotein